MSKMADLHMQIMEMLDEDYRIETIAAVLNVPVSWVYEAADEPMEYSDEY